MAHAKAKVLLGQAGIASSSTGTSNPCFVGDCRLLTLSIQTQTASASNITVSLSNTNGFQSNDSAFFWSNVTILPAQGIFTIDPGARWIRVERASGSTATVILNRYYE